MTAPAERPIAVTAAAPSRRIVRDVGVVAAASLFVALAAQIAVPFPGSPVPVTAQTLAVLLVGFGLGAKRGAAALALYLAEGAAGLPVFAGGAAGLAIFAGPTAGYLLAFPAAAFVAGALANPRSSAIRIVAASLASHAVIFAAGLAVLARFLPAGEALRAGFYPFLPGEVIKIAAALVILRGTRGLFRPKG